MATLQTINIYYETFTVGHVLIHDTGKTSFQYDPRWLATTGSFPLSVTMPLGPGDHDDEILMPWLANLLPEEQQLMALSRALGMSSTDTLAILREIGGDTAGAISIDEANNRADWSYEPLTAHYGEQTDREALSRHFDDLGRRPFLVGEDGVRLSLAGGQKKTALAVLDADGRPRLGLPGPGDGLAIPK